MLRKIKAYEFDRYAEFAYRLAMEPACSGFPLYTDGIKTKEDFLERSRRGLCREEEELLLFEREGNVQGWVHYYVIKEDCYIGICSLLIGDGQESALEELMAYWKQRFPGYEWSMYFPEENRAALSFMSRRGYRDKGKEAVNVLLFKEYQTREESGFVFPVGRENFDLFRKIHAGFEAEMYWTSDRIWEDLENWEIFAYVIPEEEKVSGDTAVDPAPVKAGKGCCKGVIYYNRQTSKDLEIFGIDVPDLLGGVVEALLIACLNKAKEAHAESMYFFNERFPNEIPEGLGFRRITTAHYFEENLSEKNRPDSCFF